MSSIFETTKNEQPIAQSTGRGNNPVARVKPSNECKAHFERVAKWIFPGKASPLSGIAHIDGWLGYVEQEQVSYQAGIAVIIGAKLQGNPSARQQEYQAGVSRWGDAKMSQKWPTPQPLPAHRFDEKTGWNYSDVLTLDETDQLAIVKHVIANKTGNPIGYVEGLKVYATKATETAKQDTLDAKATLQVKATETVKK